jgi:deoxyribodipyrimidine photo-lyase
MDLAGTSRLSADLKFGTISARTVWHATANLADEALRTDRATLVSARRSAESENKFTNELLWREFTHALLWERPELLESPFRKDFIGFPWRNDDDAWRAWTTGTTGYPIVDASARQLLAEGYVHNRARMISASFFTKHLLGDYRRAEAHYMKWLTDGDWAQNNAGWQWSAGCGADAQPYFRIFNPKTQGEKFDPEGVYIKRWVPELRSLDAKFIHAPYDAPALVLRAAGITLGRDYPLPIVVHEAARARFLETAAGHLKKHVVLAR